MSANDTAKWHYYGTGARVREGNTPRPSEALQGGWLCGKATPGGRPLASSTAARELGVHPMAAHRAVGVLLLSEGTAEAPLVCEDH